MREGKHTQAQIGLPADASPEQILYLLGEERRALGETALRGHQVGACGHRTTMDGYCWFCQARTGRWANLCPLGHGNWPAEETCVACGLPTRAQRAGASTPTARAARPLARGARSRV